MDYKDFNYEEIFNRFQNNTILVIGDVMVDTYMIGHVERISPEAPVPVCDIFKKEYKLGGASNVVINLKQLGARPIICSVIGDDEIAKTFLKLLNDNDLSQDGIIKTKDRKTTNKIRIIGNNVQMLRIDEETKTNLDTTSYLALTQKIESIIKNNKINAIIFEDYDKGVINSVLFDRVLKISNGIPIYVDPKYKNFNVYHDIKLFKPNLTEFKNGLKLDWGCEDIVDTIKKQCLILHEEKNIDKIMVTMSDRGIFISKKNGDALLLKTKPRNIVDVSGAGDAVISIATLMDIEGADLGFNAFVSNITGGIACEEVGVIPVSKYKILKEINS